MTEDLLRDVLSRQSTIIGLLVAVCVGMFLLLAAGAHVYLRTWAILDKANKTLKAAAISGSITDRNKGRTEEAVRQVGEALSSGTAEAANKADIAATKAGEAKTLIEEHHRELSNKLDTVKTLVNGGMLAQLQLNALLARRLASTTKRKDDEDAADLAERRLRDHEKAEAATR